MAAEVSSEHGQELLMMGSRAEFIGRIARPHLMCLKNPVWCILIIHCSVVLILFIFRYLLLARMTILKDSSNQILDIIRWQGSVFLGGRDHSRLDSFTI